MAIVQLLFLALILGTICTVAGLTIINSIFRFLKNAKTDDTRYIEVL